MVALDRTLQRGIRRRWDEGEYEAVARRFDALGIKRLA
jgi:hypothetical protein